MDLVKFHGPTEVVFWADLDCPDLVPHLDDVVTGLVGSVDGHVTGPESVHPRKLSSHDLGSILWKNFCP